MNNPEQTMATANGDPWAVRCRDLGKVFQSDAGQVTALSGVNLAIAPNTFTALVGPSGCGKTTLLHIIAGLDTEYEGEFASRAAAGDVAFLFQEPRLLPWLSAQANLAFIQEARGVPRKQAMATAKQFLDLVGLSGFERQFPSQLSGGMQQRVAMARALMVNPAIMLMDEPFASLDELTARRLRMELLRLYQENPHTVIFVTHNVTEAAYLADRVIVLGRNPGSIVADISVDLPRPRDYDGPEVAKVARAIIAHLHWEEGD
jgi:ABC-type nitrate/sulfonate/bicarbonate transport system ATPase subunit